MQSAVPYGDGYLYTDENGREIYFEKTDRTCTTHTGKCYNFYEDVNGEGMELEPGEGCLFIRQNGTYRMFHPYSGLLFRYMDEYANHMDVPLNKDWFTDGACRYFDLKFEDVDEGPRFLTYAATPDGTTVTYSYTDDFLTGINYPDGRKARIAYSANKPSSVTLLDAEENAVFKVVYAFNGEKVSSVTEYGVENGEFTEGTVTSFAYSPTYKRTVVTSTESPDTVYLFDEDGNVTEKYSTAEEEKDRRNLLGNGNFESLSSWQTLPSNCDDVVIENAVSGKFAKTALRISSCGDGCGEVGVFRLTNVMASGKYVFSAYLRPVSNITGNEPGAFLRVTDTSDNVICESERLTSFDDGFSRIALPFEITSAESLKVQIVLSGIGEVIASAAQLEKGNAVREYNMLADGWNRSSGSTYSNGKIAFTGDVGKESYATQTLSVKSPSSVADTFVFSGFAKANGITSTKREGLLQTTFRLRAVLHYTDCNSEEFVYDFLPYTDGLQFGSLEFTKSRFAPVESITVYCEYDNNIGSAEFEGLSLCITSRRTDVTAADFAIENADAEYEEEVIEETAAPFTEAYDNYGNALTETVFADGELGTLYRSFEYSNGNDLVRQTDNRGNDTLYTVDTLTSRNTEVTDRCGNKTAFEYDCDGKTTKVTAKKADGTELSNVSYSYDDFDNVTEILRGDGLEYDLEYNAFRKLKSVKVGNGALVNYTYKDGNGKLKEVTYANGDKMTVTYNANGIVTCEKWYNSDGELTAHYKYVPDREGNVIFSLDILSEKEYDYEYEEGRAVRITECTVDLDGENVTCKYPVNTVKYYYSSDGNLIKKKIIPADGDERTVFFETADNSSKAVFTVGVGNVTARTATDGFGRKTFDEIQLGTGAVFRRFSYLTGEITPEHSLYEKVKSEPTTRLVERITYADGKTLSYEYDNEERITKVTDSLGTVTEYTYDALGQLLCETVNSNPVNTVTYDNYGNISSKNGILYTYGDPINKDLLTAVGQNTVTYDAQGNPISYLGHTLTWEKGRQLKSFDNNLYTYNANGIRTSKRVGGIKHNYILEGTKILRETWQNNTLVPLYDSEDSVCGITFNGEAYYFNKNLQGDVISITDNDAVTVATYSYDAWGVPTVLTDTTDCNIATINPYRYRGYYYDSDTGLYYLQSRYYDPTVGRFINADDISCLGTNTVVGSNLFVYCENNAINHIDLAGYKAIDVTIRLTAIMCINALYLYSLARLYKWAGFVGKLALLYKFYTLVKTNGKWDLKNQSAWKLKSEDYYTFMGIKLTAADIGNIHFGFVGSVLFSWKTLCAGAGLYQIYSGTSSWKFWYSFFDDPRDTLCISMGRAMWKIVFRKWVFQW